MAPKYTRHEDGYSTLETDGGHKVHLIDPDGSFERSMSDSGQWTDTEMGRKQVQDIYGAHKPDRDPVPQAVNTATVGAAAAAALAQPSNVGPMNSPVVLPDAPPVQASVAPLGAAPGAGPKATLSDAPAGDIKTTSKESVTDQHSTTSSGMDAGSKAAVLAAGDRTRTSMNAASDADKQAGNAVADQRDARAKQDFMSGYTKQVGALEAEDRYKGAYDAAMKERAAAHAQKADPAKTWGNEKNEWAFIAGLGGALAALDTGIGRLNAARGRGYQVEPFDMIQKMVDANLKQQEQERQHRLDAAGESAEDARMGMLRASSDAKEAAAQVLDARKLAASSAEERAFLESGAAKLRLQRDLHDEDLAKATATQKSVTDARNTVTATSTGPAAGEKLTKAQHDDQANLRQLYRIRDTLRRAEKSGALQGVVGWQDKLGANGIQGFFGGLPPEQKEAATALGELEIGNLMRLVREPNNKNTQNMVQSLGMPKNDSDIPGSMTRLDQLIAEQEDAVKNVAPDAPAEQREQY